MKNLKFVDLDNTPPLKWRVEKDDSYITITHDEGRKYEIENERCETPAQVCHWVCHLAEKNWVTPLMLQYFVLVALGDEVWTW